MEPQKKGQEPAELSEELKKLADELPQEGDLPEDTEETPAGSSPAKKEGTPAGEGKQTDDLPFHKHPRWLAYQKERKAMKAELEEAKQVINELKGAISGLGDKKAPEGDIPKWFGDTFGYDKDAWTQFQEHSVQNQKAIVAQAVDIIKKELASNQQHQKDEQAQMAQWVEDQLESLKDENLEFDRKELLDVMAKYSPVNQQGIPDFHKGYDILQILKSKPDSDKSAKDKARKEAAAATMKGGTPSPSVKVDMNNIRKSSFHELVQG